VVKVGAEDIGEQSRSFRIETLPMSSAVMLGGARPSLSDPALRWWVQVASTCDDCPSRRQPPSRLRPGSLWLHPTVGRSLRAAAVNRPTRRNARKEHSAAIKIPSALVRLCTSSKPVRYFA
jgi:hypothetical protein